MSRASATAHATAEDGFKGFAQMFRSGHPTMDLPDPRTTVEVHLANGEITQLVSATCRDSMDCKFSPQITFDMLTYADVQYVRISVVDVDATRHDNMGVMTITRDQLIEAYHSKRRSYARGPLDDSAIVGVVFSVD